MIRTFTLTLLLAILPGISLALPASVNSELQEYIRVFQGNDWFRQKQIAQTLEWSGLTQPELFDLIEAKLLDRYETEDDKHQADYLAWLCKALAFSGNDKYRLTIQRVAANAEHGKLRKHAKLSLAILDQYKQWNHDIIVESQWREDQSADVNRFTAMIQSDVLELKRLAAKRVHFKHLYEESLMDLLEQQLLANYQTDSGHRLYVDSWAWVCKALAGSRNPKYKATIEKVAQQATHKKLRKYAKKYLQYYSS
ncbi:hypothetical protein HBA55_31865 [Pseudomaricurvus alkylphenolicus]|uniref:hypothetical protein n=1 Tax=Pseudomaricurvus alkylphenolicus TaxID=1306991 RepID=UPI00142418EC|nr:hypothetical protein [Pseudomaricurvus alkylphenolicus]NIB44240.1 hypothetical protein [Pseudomaricurvus alkylphenolicus]